MSQLFLVMRGVPGGWAVPQVSFADEAIAHAHAADAAEATGAQHHVVPLELAAEQPASSRWYSMSLEMSITGQELWRQESEIVQFDAHPGAIHEATMTWQVSIRYTPSQPPCRVRVKLVGPDRDWCLERAEGVWALAAGSPEFAEAAAIEAMLEETLTEG